MASSLLFVWVRAGAWLSRKPSCNPCGFVGGFGPSQNPWCSLSWQLREPRFLRGGSQRLWGFANLGASNLVWPHNVPTATSSPFISKSRAEAEVQHDVEGLLGGYVLWVCSPANFFEYLLKGCHAAIAAAAAVASLWHASLIPCCRSSKSLAILRKSLDCGCVL